MWSELRGFQEVRGVVRFLVELGMGVYHEIMSMAHAAAMQKYPTTFHFTLVPKRSLNQRPTFSNAVLFPVCRTCRQSVIACRFWPSREPPSSPDRSASWI